MPVMISCNNNDHNMYNGNNYNETDNTDNIIISSSMSIAYIIVLLSNSPTSRVPATGLATDAICNML